MTSKIIADLRSENNNAFGILYKEYFGMVLRFVTNNSGRTVDAEDIFQDAMLVLVQKMRQDDFELTASLKTYIMAISKNLWLKRLRTSYRETELTAVLDDQFFEEIDLAIEQERSYKDQLQAFLHKITTHCQGLIHDMFFKERTIDEIKRDYGYSSKHNAQNQKHKCIEQIRREKERQEMSGRK